MMAQSRTESTRDSYNYGQYINQFPPNTIKVIREFERIQKKICRHKMFIMFNEIWINEEILPKYTYIYNIYIIYIYIYIYNIIYIYICISLYALFIYNIYIYNLTYYLPAFMVTRKKEKKKSTVTRDNNISNYRPGKK